MSNTYDSAFTGEEIDNGVAISLHGAPTVTVTLLPYRWSGGTQTVIAPNVTADSAVFSAPSVDSQDSAEACGVRCTKQGNGTVTFKCKAKTTETIKMTVTAWGSTPAIYNGNPPSNAGDIQKQVDELQAAQEETTVAITTIVGDIGELNSGLAAAQAAADAADVKAAQAATDAATADTKATQAAADAATANTKATAAGEAATAADTKATQAAAAAQAADTKATQAATDAATADVKATQAAAAAAAAISGLEKTDSNVDALAADVQDVRADVDEIEKEMQKMGGGGGESRDEFSSIAIYGTADGYPILATDAVEGVTTSVITLTGYSYKDSEVADSPVYAANTIIVRNKNLVDFPYVSESQTVNGVTFTVNYDGTITADGTATSDATFVLNESSALDSTQYKCSGTPAGGSTETYYMTFAGTTETGDGVDVYARDIPCSITIKSGFAASALWFRPQIEYNSSITPFTTPQKKEYELYPLDGINAYTNALRVLPDGRYSVSKQVERKRLTSADTFVYDDSFHGYAYTDAAAYFVGTPIQMYCSKFKTLYRGDYNVSNYGITADYSSTTKIIIRDGTSDVEQFKAWLDSTDCEIVYRLRRPVTYTVPIDDARSLASMVTYSGNTTFYPAGKALYTNVSIKYCKHVLAALEARIAALEGA